MDLHKKLLAALEDVFGTRNPNTSRFGSSALGEIADQLCLSNSLLTKLISGTATQGMYERSLNNLERIKETRRLVAENEEYQSKLKRKTRSSLLKKAAVAFLLLAIVPIVYALTELTTKEDPTTEVDIEAAINPLDKFFNPDFDKPSFLPYVPSEKVQEYCPCSGYEGDWTLTKPYVIPIPFNKPGLYYMAKSSDVKLKCVTSGPSDQRGKQMHGFETMKHELWMDSKQEPLVPKYFNSENKQYTKDFYNLNFEQDERFEKVAEFTSLFYNSLTIQENKIIRKGEPAGRYATYQNEEAVSKYKININEILNHVVGNMIKVSCDEITNPYCNPNSLIEGESSLDFTCNFTITTENLGNGGTYPYTKGFKLKNQHYSNNLICDCEQE